MVYIKIYYNEDYIYNKDLFVKINLRKRKWLFNCSYNPHKKNMWN